MNRVQRSATLIVDDAPEFVQIVTSDLRARGHRVRSAGSIADALPIASVPPDLVILGPTLPDGDGLALCRMIPRAVDTS